MRAFRPIRAGDDSPTGRRRGTRRWQLSVLAPALLAGVLVVVLAVQSMRAIQVHRRMVATGLKDYAAFAAWQYTRRASDYIRLVLITTLREHRERERRSGGLSECSNGGTGCPPQLAYEGIASCTLDSTERIVIGRNTTQLNSGQLRDVLASALTESSHSGYYSGLTTVKSGTKRQLLGYWFLYEGKARGGTCAAAPFSLTSVLPMLEHVAAFAPLLPRTLVGRLPNDSLLSIDITTSDGVRIARIGNPSSGISASDVLGPNMGDMRVVVTLHPAATERLIAGGIPPSNTPALVGMLVLTLLMGVVAIRQLRRSQEMVQLRNDFVASVSHELKTPLAQISLFADTLAAPRERTPGERSEYLGIIGREAKRLGQLVDSILLFAGMTRDSSATLNAEPTLLGEEIRAAVAAFEPLAEARQVSIVTDFVEEIQLPLERSAFRQVMLNAFDNALKFGPDGQQIIVRMQLHGDNARIQIDDGGAGVPERERNAIFEPFVRIDRANVRGGSGIGLAVVSDVVKRHGGTVALGDAPTGGARLEIMLPHAQVMSDIPVSA